MDKTYIDTQQVVDRYVQGKLTDDELDMFEVYMLDHPETVDDVEYAKGMQKALANADDKLLSVEAMPPTAKSYTSFWLSRNYALAATVLLAVTVTFSAYLFQQVDGLRSDIAKLQQPAPITSEVWFEPVRGIPERVIERRKDTAFILRIDVSATPANAYTVTLHGDEIGVVWSQSQIDSDDEQSIPLVLSWLPAGGYRISVGVDDRTESTATIAEYRFVLRQLEE